MTLSPREIVARRLVNLAGAVASGAVVIDAYNLQEEFDTLDAGSLGAPGEIVEADLPIPFKLEIKGRRIRESPE
jgi:hypothetical protein